MLPCIALAGAFINHISSSSKVKQLNLQAESGSIAEEVIATIRTSHAFGITNTLAGLFNQKVDETQRLEKKMALGMGPGMGAFIFVVYSSYGLGECLIHIKGLSAISYQRVGGLVQIKF
jgi:ATP-binding cassette subfamily B (MDR/TAP) protein 1